MRLTILVPAYNEEKTILETIDRVARADTGAFEKEIIVIDDGSSDATAALLRKAGGVVVLRHERQRGKGAAIRTGIAHATGSWTLVQDADLEYNPKEYPKLLGLVREEHFKEGGTRSVYGMRSYRQGYVHYRIGAYLLTALINLLFGSRLRDSYTCYKLIPTDVLRSLDLRSDGFEVEAEITVKLLQKKARIIEVPIEYHPRKFNAGKKIRAQDAMKGIRTIWRLWRTS